jgi:glucose-1-phosphate thymidylyltransferase
MKAVVLARGAGRRMRVADASVALTPAQAAAALAGLKSVMPVGPDERPFLDYVLSALADAACHEVCIVVGPDHDEVRRCLTGGRAPTRLAVTFAVQEVADGTAHAVLAAEPFAGGEPFLVLNADNLYPLTALRAMAALDGPGLAAFERDRLVADSGFAEERVSAFALLEVDGAGRLSRIVEKPGRTTMEAAGARALVSMNLWRFDRDIFGPCRDLPRSARGEFELPEAVELALERGMPFRVVRAQGPVLDLSHQSDISVVSRLLVGHEVRL